MEGWEWCSQAFPNLYALSKAKEACVADLWEQREREREGGGGDFAKNLNDWELDSMEMFLLKLQGHLVNREQNDKVVWNGDSKGSFSVRSFYTLSEPDCATHFLVEIIWNP